MKSKLLFIFLTFIPLFAFASGEAETPAEDKVPVFDAVNTPPPPRIIYPEEQIIFTNQWIREPSSTSVNTAGYFNLTNNLDYDIILTEAETEGEICDRTEIHGYKNDEEVKRMYKLESVTVPAKTTIEFAPGGFHVMLMGLKAPVNSDMRPVIKFKFLPADTANKVVLPEIAVIFPVK